MRFLGLIAAVVLAVTGYQSVASPLRSLGLSSGIAYIVAALVIFLGVTVLAWFAARALTKLVNFTKWGMLNKAGGASLGALWALVWVAVVLAAISFAPEGTVKEKVEESVLADAIAREAPQVAGAAARADLRRLVVSLLG